MNGKAFDILKEKRFRLLAPKYFGNIEKQRTARFLKAQSFAGKRKCLTWKSGTKNIKIIGYVSFCIFGCYVAERHLSVVREIRFLGICVPFRGEYASPAKILQSHTKTADAGEQVDESKRWVLGAWKWNIEQLIEQSILSRCRLGSNCFF